MFAKVKDGCIVEFPINDIRSLFPNTSFPEKIIDKSLPDGYVTVTRVSPPKVKRTQKAVVGLPVLSATGWTQSWEIQNKTDRELETDSAILSRTARAERDRRIAKCDWVVTVATENKTEMPKVWIDYRQALRDITLQPTFPFDIVWPIAPV